VHRRKAAAAPTDEGYRRPSNSRICADEFTSMTAAETFHGIQSGLKSAAPQMLDVAEVLRDESTLQRCDLAGGER
jgi:hypothetical protein